MHEERAKHYGEPWDPMQRFLVIDTIDNKWKDHLYAMEVLKTGISLRGYAQIDPKNEYKKEGFEKFQLLKSEIADHVTSFLYKLEATDTIRDMVTGKLRSAPPPQQQMQMPRSPQELQALFESLVAAGKIPQEVMDRMAKGERFVLRVTQQGLVLQPAPPDAAAPAQAPAAATAGGAAPGEGAVAAAAPAPAAPSPPPPQRRLAPAMSAPNPFATPKKPQAGPKPGRNDPCPCGSGIKYKKCCAPAFD
jgi:preprotein translocase subunit SecA